jgi:hypothetical protein
MDPVLNHRLFQRFTAACSDNEPWFAPLSGCAVDGCFEGIDDRLQHEHHPRPSAERLVVNFSVFIGGEDAEVHNPHLATSFDYSPSKHRLSEGRIKIAGENGQDIDFQGQAFYTIQAI